MMTVNYNGQEIEVNADAQVESNLEAVKTVKRGQFAFVSGHISGQDNDKCITPTVSNIWFHMNPRYENYLKRNVEKIEAVKFEDVAFSPELMEKNAGGDLEALFNTAKANKLASAQKSLESDGYRVGQNLCYASKHGFSLHLETESVTVDGKAVKRPVRAENGLYTVTSIMLPFYIVRRINTQDGTWKSVNSRALTLMQEAILKRAGVKDWKAFSLCKGNFQSMSLNSQTILGLVKANGMNEVSEDDDATCAICDLSLLPIVELEREATQTVKA